MEINLPVSLIILAPFIGFGIGILFLKLSAKYQWLDDDKEWNSDGIQTNKVEELHNSEEVNMNKHIIICLIMFSISIGSAVYILLNIANTDRIFLGFTILIMSCVIGFVSTQKAKEELQLSEEVER